VVFIPYQEIRSARLVRERTKIPGHDGISTQTRRLVELELAGAGVAIDPAEEKQVSAITPIIWI
jgi:hypothetical protein